MPRILPEEIVPERRAAFYLKGKREKEGIEEREKVRAWSLKEEGPEREGRRKLFKPHCLFISIKVLK